ncbi:MAG TPA: hypothetical protein VIQ02_06295, partial [Jiangellaceae bacterium]
MQVLAQPLALGERGSDHALSLLRKILGQASGADHNGEVWCQHLEESRVSGRHSGFASPGADAQRAQQLPAVAQRSIGNSPLQRLTDTRHQLTLHVPHGGVRGSSRRGDCLQHQLNRVVRLDLQAGANPVDDGERVGSLAEHEPVDEPAQPGR